MGLREMEPANGAEEADDSYQMLTMRVTGAKFKTGNR